MAQTINFQLEGMRCAACASAIEKAIAKVPGVESSQVNFALEQATVNYQEQVSTEAIEKAVEKAGYHAKALPKDGRGLREETEQQRPVIFQPKLLVGLVVSGVLFFGSLPMMLGINIPYFPHIFHNPWLQWALATPVQFW